jgi:hypothetical protein
MSECLIVLAYLPWMRFHAERVLRQTLQRTRKRRARRPNRHSDSCGRGNAEWVFSE